MRRRLTIAMILMVLATLVLSGLATLAVETGAVDSQTRHELVREGDGLAASVQSEADNGADPARALHSLLLALRAPLRLDGSAVLAVTADGVLFDPAPLDLHPALPAGLTAADLHPAKLYAMQTVSGQSGGVVYAAVPFLASLQIRNRTVQLVQVVLLTRRPPSALATAGPWFLLSALLILLVAVVVAWRLARRFVAPVTAAQEVTVRIAAGDLAARVPDPPGADPELAGLASSINSMAAGLARAKEAERHFLQSVSHDLRTPLTSIRGFAEAIEDGATGDAVAAAGIIASEARRLQRLVGDLLSLATVEARRFTLQTQTFDLASAAADTTAGFAPSATELGLSLVMDRPPGPCPVTADPDRVAQVVANLVENALRYASTTVRVGVGPGPAGPQLWVADDGPGIPAADLPRVFDRLFVSRPRPDRPIGSGLGLTIVAELARAMGGTVRAESPIAPSGGTRMVVTLPGPQPGAPYEPPHDRGPSGRAQTNGSVGNDPPSTGAGSAPSTRSSTVA